MTMTDVRYDSYFRVGCVFVSVVVTLIRRVTLENLELHFTTI